VRGVGGTIHLTLTLTLTLTLAPTPTLTPTLPLTLTKAWAAQLHVAGVFNADPHPGNILVSTAG